MAYQFILEDLAGRQRSDLPGATGKQFARAILGMSTASVTVPLWHEQADFLLDGDALLRVSDTSVTPHLDVYRGTLVTAEEKAGDGKGSVKASFADGFWTLTRRLCGKSTTGFSQGTAGAPVAATAIIAALVNATAAESPAGIRMGSVSASPATAYTGPHFYKKVGELIAELSAVLDGPDWRVDPIATTSTTNPALCDYCELVVAPDLGTYRSEQPFEYGDGRLNVKSYSRVVSKESVANAVYNVPSGFPDGAGGPVMTASSPSSQAARGLLEDVVATDLTVDQLRKKLVELHIAVRANPRQTIEFEPVNDLSGERLPKLRVDYDVGDVVPFRAAVRQPGGTIGKLDKRLDILGRIFQVEVTVDEEGVGQPKFTISPPT